MDKQAITSRQGISMIILFISGSTLVLGTAGEAQADIWIAILIGLAATCLIVLMYGRILSKFPGKNLYDIIINVFGNYIGRIICLFFIFYSFYLAALVVVNFSMFISVVGLESTPESLVAFVVILLVVIGVKMGVEVLGRWSEFFARILYPIVLLTVPLMLYMTEANHLKPILAEGLAPVLDGALSVMTFPFAEIVIFTMIFSSKAVVKSKSIYKIFIMGLLFGGLLIFITAVSSYQALGPFAYPSSYFPLYSAVSRINIKDVLERVEIVIAVSFMIGGFVKICACVLACCNGIIRVANLKDYRFIVTPIGLLILLVSLTTYSNIMEMVSAFSGFRYVAVFIQILLPLIVLVAVEIKLWVNKKKDIHQESQN